MSESLSPGLTTRPPRPADIDAVYRLIAENDTYILGSPDFDEPELRDAWRFAALEDDARVVEDGAGAIVGYALVNDHNRQRPTANVYVHHDALGRGIGTWLARWVEERARSRLHLAPEGSRIVLEAMTHADDAPSNELLANEGHAVERYFLRMMINVGEVAPPAPVWPSGVTLRTLVPGADDRAVFEAVEESFSDHWGYVARTYDDWRRRVFGEKVFDPSLWFLAVDGDQIAGVAICGEYPTMAQAWVFTVGVRRPWRRRGVAAALLHHAFREFRRRGRTTVSLGVDAQSLTGATRVYERAGMHVAHRFALYVKEIRPGVDLAVRELTA